MAQPIQAMSEATTRLPAEQAASPNTQQFGNTASSLGSQVANEKSVYSQPDATTQAALELKAKYMAQNASENTNTAQSAGNANQQRQANLISTEDSGAATKAQMQLQENIALQYFAGAPSSQTFKLSDPNFAARVYDNVAAARAGRDRLMSMG